MSFELILKPCEELLDNMKSLVTRLENRENYTNLSVETICKRVQHLNMRIGDVNEDLEKFMRSQWSDVGELSEMEEKEWRDRQHRIATVKFFTPYIVAYESCRWDINKSGTASNIISEKGDVVSDPVKVHQKSD